MNFRKIFFFSLQEINSQHISPCQLFYISNIYLYYNYLNISLIRNFSKHINYIYIYFYKEKIGIINEP